VVWVSCASPIMLHPPKLQYSIAPSGVMTCVVVDVAGGGCTLFGEGLLTHRLSTCGVGELREPYNASLIQTSARVDRWGAFGLGTEGGWPGLSEASTTAQSFTSPQGSFIVGACSYPSIGVGFVWEGTWALWKCVGVVLVVWVRASYGGGFGEAPERSFIVVRHCDAFGVACLPALPGVIRAAISLQTCTLVTYSLCMLVHA
jgi:hypothetical protein